MEKSRKIIRTNPEKTRWCEIDLRYDTERKRLSITGSEGRIISRDAAGEEALEYWRSFFAEEKDQFKNFLAKWGHRFHPRTPEGAAEFVLRTDGEFHGLDVHYSGVTNVYLIESCGQIVETLETWFPEYADLLPHHLNDLHAECVHQAARGETWKTHPLVVCPECGWKLGSGWKTHPIPEEITQKILTLLEPVAV